MYENIVAKTAPYILNSEFPVKIKVTMTLIKHPIKRLITGLI